MLPEGVPAADDEAARRQIWLAGEMAAVVGLRRVERDEYYGGDVLSNLRKQLAALLDTGRLLPAQRLAAGDALAALGDPRPGVCTLEPIEMSILVFD